MDMLASSSASAPLRSIPGTVNPGGVPIVPMSMIPGQVPSSFQSQTLGAHMTPSLPIPLPPQPYYYPPTAQTMYPQSYPYYPNPIYSTQPTSQMLAPGIQTMPIYPVGQVPNPVYSAPSVPYDPLNPTNNSS